MPVVTTPPDFAASCANLPAQDFSDWMEAAHDAHEPEPTAMALSTLASDGAPRLRWVLCKGWGEDGLRFFTNLGSEKGRNLAADVRVAAAFHWAAMHRQVRVEGAVEPLPAADVDAYYESRPRLSRLGAWASRQSQPLADRQELLDSVRAVETRFQAQTPPRPPYWSGFRIVPHRWEFWQGREGRLHDRRVCQLVGDAWLQWALYP
jgi:pyridoxamine 5'-phosphate oxidase